MHSRTMNFLLGMLILLHGCTPSSDALSTSDEAQEEARRFPVSSRPDVVPVDPDFHYLTLDQFQAFQGDVGTWTKEGDLIICSGLPQGYLYSKEPYRNFTLRGELQFILTVEQKQKPDQASTGILVGMQPPHEIWPASLRIDGTPERLGMIHSLGNRPPVAVTDQEPVREQVRLPIDQWNAFEISVQEGTVTSRLNGETVCTSQSDSPIEGLIGFQSNGYVVRFRNLRLRRDAAQPSPETQAAQENKSTSNPTSSRAVQ